MPLAERLPRGGWSRPWPRRRIVGEMTAAAFHPSCDRGHAASHPAGAVDHPRWDLGRLDHRLEASPSLTGRVVNVALPTLGASLHGTPADLQWTVNGYLLPLSALLLLGGAAGDNFGRRRLLMMGVVLFAIASVGCALASSFAMLVAMRALQGVGAAMLMPNSLALLGASLHRAGARAGHRHLGGGRRRRQRDRAAASAAG